MSLYLALAIELKGIWIGGVCYNATLRLRAGNKWLTDSWIENLLENPEN